MTHPWWVGTIWANSDSDSETACWVGRYDLGQL